MSTASLFDVAVFLDETLRTTDFPDYPGAVNGVQFDNRGSVSAVAAAVDLSTRTIEGAAARSANLLLVHHGMFWGPGPFPLRDWRHRRIRLLLEHDIAVYSAHLPLDAHAVLGNNVLLARELALDPTDTFSQYRGVPIGVSGKADLQTTMLVGRLDEFARRNGGRALATPFSSGRRTSSWAICTGAGADSAALLAAHQAGIDTLIVGEGPHHTAVEAQEYGIVVIYAGHYATETLGVKALAAFVAQRFALDWHFIDAPTGL